MDEIWTIYNSLINGMGEIERCIWHERYLIDNYEYQIY